MSNLLSPTAGDADTKKNRRHSFEPQSAVEPSANFRHTLSHNYGSNKVKKPKPKDHQAPAMPEIPEVHATNDHVRISATNVDERKHAKSRIRGSGRSVGSRASGRAYDNAGFVPDRPLSRTNSNANSIRSSASIYSSTQVVKEQYCCCSQRTPCERILFATVGVLSCIIIILIIVVVLVSKSNSDSGKKSILNQIFHI